MHIMRNKKRLINIIYVYLYRLYFISINLIGLQFYQVASISFIKGLIFQIEFFINEFTPENGLHDIHMKIHHFIDKHLPLELL